MKTYVLSYVAILVICYEKFPKLTAAKLYRSSDNVTLLNADNVNKFLQNRSTLWLVEFYLDWCEHCKEFAPIYKSIAKDIANWSWIIRLGAIDCGGTAPSGEENYLACHHRPFWVADYPELRYFSFNSSEGGNVLEVSVDSLETRKNILNLIEDNLHWLNWNHRVLKPDFLPVSASFVINHLLLESTFEKVRYVALVLENASSSMGKEIILDMSSCANIVVRRTVNHKSIKELTFRYNVTDQLPVVLVATSNQSVIPVNVSMKTRYFYVYQLQKLSGVGKPEARSLEMDELGEISKTFSVNSEDIKRDKVYLADIESGLHYMFTMEISANRVLAGSKLEVVKRLIHLLASIGNHFPAQHTTIKFFKALDWWIRPRDGVTSEEWLKEISKRKSGAFLTLSSKRWVECQSSADFTRGYPCSLWILFHAMSVAACNANIGGDSLVGTVQDYILNFFGCRKCRENFKKEIKNTPFKPTNRYSPLLWLWQIHNNVNKRISTKQSRNLALKIQYPPVDLCPKCHDQVKGEWNESEVVSFLLHRYSPQNICFDYLEDNITMLAESVKEMEKRVWEKRLKLALYIKGNNGDAMARFHPRNLVRSKPHVYMINSLNIQLVGFEVCDIFLIVLIAFACIATVAFFLFQFKSGDNKLYKYIQ